MPAITNRPDVQVDLASAEIKSEAPVSDQTVQATWETMLKRLQPTPEVDVNLAEASAAVQSFGPALAAFAGPEHMLAADPQISGQKNIATAAEVGAEINGDLGAIVKARMTEGLLNTGDPFRSAHMRPPLDQEGGVLIDTDRYEGPEEQERQDVAACQEIGRDIGRRVLAQADALYAERGIEPPSGVRTSLTRLGEILGAAAA